MRHTRLRSCRHHGLALAIALGLGGCSLIPVPFKELRQQALEHVQTPEKWRQSKALAEPVRNEWLATFGDAQLDALVQEALSYNTDLRAAAARVEQAVGYVKIANAQLYPVISLFGKTGDKSGSGGGLDIGVLNVSWELDVWGRIRYARNAASEEYAAAEYDLAYARQSLAALVAKSWYASSEAWLQLQLAENTARSAQDLLRLARDRLRVGAGDSRDVAIAQASLHAAQDTVRRLRLGYTNALRALELLVGRYPAAEVQVRRELPVAYPPVPVGMPSDLLERRPDVLAAERRVAAAFNRVEESRAAQLPSISLTGGASWVSSDLLVLKNRDNPKGSFGASLLAPIYRAGELQAQVEISTAEQKQAVAEYGSVALRAFGEVENALNGEFVLAEREPLLAAAVQDNEQALALTEVQYRVGKVDLRAVKSQQIDLYQARSQLLRVQSERVAQRVNLYLALGGDFGSKPAKPEAAQPVAALGR
jgi:NodT family efflux transporter outer membrane factor (OMF) lipoprotein